MFVSFNPVQNTDRSLDLEYIILTVLAFEPILVLVFKLFSVLYDNIIKIKPEKSFFRADRIQ